VAETELKQITYWLTRDDRAPVASEYLVTIGKHGRINSVYCIATVRPVKHRDPATEKQHYALGVVPTQEAKPLAEYDEETGEVWVQGVPAHGIWWASRDKKAA
jgi:hypothetical protein